MFKVGDLVIGNSSNNYTLTGKGVVCKVVGLDVLNKAYFLVKINDKEDEEVYQVIKESFDLYVKPKEDSKMFKLGDVIEYTKKDCKNIASVPRVKYLVVNTCKHESSIGIKVYGQNLSAFTPYLDELKKAYSTGIIMYVNPNDYRPYVLEENISTDGIFNYKVGDKLLYLRGDGEPIEVTVDELLPRYMVSAKSGKIYGGSYGIKQGAFMKIDKPDKSFSICRGDSVWIKGVRHEVINDTLLDKIGFIQVCDTVTTSIHRRIKKYVHYKDIDPTGNGKTYEFTMADLEKKLGLGEGTLRIKK